MNLNQQSNMLSHFSQYQTANDSQSAIIVTQPPKINNLNADLVTIISAINDVNTRQSSLLSTINQNVANL